MTSLDRSRRRRAAAAAAASIVAIAMFASLGGVGLAKSHIGAAQYQYGTKVTICHKGKNTLTVSAKALPAHLRHHDTVGACTSGHKKNTGKHKGESHHAPNPATGSGEDSSGGQAAANGHGQGHGQGQGHDD